MRTIVVTGATRGLGRALVALFGREGHRVSGCGRSREHVEELRSSLGAPHYFGTVDVAEDSDVRAWANSTLEEMGAPDLLINNAGLINTPSPLWQISEEEFRAVIECNVMGTANVIRAFVPHMVARGSGVIVNMSSGWGRSTSPEVAPYCASKFAIEGLTSALAQELPAGMAATAVSPGVVDTDMLRTAWADGAGAYPKPDAWAKRAVPFLLNLGAADNGRALTIG